MPTKYFTSKVTTPQECSQKVSAAGLPWLEHFRVKCYTREYDNVFPLQSDPLQKAMTAFAAALDVPTSKVKFSFDGEDISPSQTAEDLELENDYVIDAIVL